MSTSKKEKESKKDEIEPSLEEGFQINILDLIAVFASYAKKITDSGIKSPFDPSMFTVADTFIKSQKSDKLIYDFIKSSHEDWDDFYTAEEEKDENGNKIPKRDKNGNKILMKDKDGNKIPSKNETMLFKNIKSLFPMIPQTGIESLKEMMSTKDKKGKNIVTKEDKDSIWDYVLVFIQMGITYVHEQRCWGNKADGKRGYTMVFFKDISVSKYAKIFDVDIKQD